MAKEAKIRGNALGLSDYQTKKGNIMIEMSREVKVGFILGVNRAKLVIIRELMKFYIANPDKIDFVTMSEIIEIVQRTPVEISDTQADGENASQLQDQ